MVLIQSFRSFIVTMSNILRNLRLVWRFLAEDHRVIYRSIEEGRMKIGSRTACGIDCIMKEIVIPPRTAMKIPTTIFVDKCSKWIKPTVAPRSGSFLIIELDPVIGSGDSDYRGEFQVVVRNTSDKPYTIKEGASLYQLLFEWIMPLDEVLCSDDKVKLIDRERGDGGFGSSDKYH